MPGKSIEDRIDRASADRSPIVLLKYEATCGNRKLSAGRLILQGGHERTRKLRSFGLQEVNPRNRVDSFRADGCTHDR